MRVKVRRKQRMLAAAAWCAPCEAQELDAQAQAARPVALAVEDEEPPEDDKPDDDEAPPEDKPEDEDAGAVLDDGTVARWSGVIATENELTGDGRMIEAGALFWEDLPLPLRWDIEDDGAHSGAVVVGLIETMERRGDDIWATGFIDLVSENGWNAAQHMDRGTLKGVSIDPDSVDYEVRISAEIYDEYTQELFYDEETDTVVDENGDPVEEEEPERDADGRVVVYEGSSDDEVMVYVSARIRAATLVDLPAFSRALIALDGPLPMTQPSASSGDLVRIASGGTVDMAMVASAAPVRPPAAWFADPKLKAPTPFTVTKDGRVFGHIAIWGSCHTGYASCVTPPRSNTGYAMFRTGVLLTAEGSEVAVGRVSIDGPHASTAASLNQAVAHYDNTTRAAADVAAGEDAHGIWVAGAVRPTLTAEQLRVLRASPMSGDWRTSGGNLELCHVLGVNMPGFPVPRGMVASGRQSCAILPSPLKPLGEPVKANAADGLSPTERRELRALIADGRRVKAARGAEAAAMARQIEADSLAHDMVGV